MKEKIDLSIIIVNFNTHKFLIEAIKSIFSGYFPLTRLEIIIIDNNSSMLSVDAIRKFIGTLKFTNIKLIRNSVNLGFAKANNQGIKVTSGKYILFLNPDTIVSKNSLVRIVNFMGKNEKVGISTCRVLLPNGILDDSCHRGFPTPWNAFCHFSNLATLFPSSLFFNGYHLGYRNLDKIHEIDSCAGSFMLVKKEAGQDIDWFDEDYFWYGEDLDFCYRMKKKAWKVMFIPDESIIHMKGVASGIKTHSRQISTATIDTKISASRARFSVMRIFYQKYYQSIYPSWLTRLVLTGIKLIESLVMLKYYANRN